jgi:hypothetical protein
MATRLSAGLTGKEIAPLNIAAGADDDFSRGQATNLSGSHRPTTNNIRSQVEYFADEIVLGELEKREIMGVPINRRMSRAIVACFCVAFILLAVILGKAFSGGDDHEESHNEVQITKAEGDMRYQLFKDALEPVTGASIATTGTPEADALAWMSYDDPAQIDPHADIDKVIQRFVLATLYLSTSGDDWEHSYSFMSHHDECEWNHSGDSTGGAYCNSKGSVDSLILASLNLDGTIPKDLGLLTQLTHLDLSHNNMHQHLPSSIGLLHQLKHLDVSEYFVRS